MLSQHFRTMPRHADLPDSLVLVRCAENLFYFGLIGQIVSSLRMQQPIRIEQFVLRSLNLKGVYLWALLWQAYRDARRVQEYFKNTKPALYLTYQTLYSMWLSALDKAGRKEAGNGVG